MAGYITYNGVSIRWFPWAATGDGRADIRVAGGFLSFDTLVQAKAWIDAGQNIGDLAIHPI